MVSAIARYLPDFSVDAPANPPASPPLGLPLFVRPRAVEPQPQAPVEDTAELVRAAQERGREEGRAEAREAFEAALASERARFAEDMAAERRRWSEEEAERLAARFGLAFQEAEAKLTAGVARVMVPFLAEALRSQVLDELQATLVTLAADKRHATMRISGPEDLISALGARLAGCGPSLEFVVDEGPDVRVLADETIIETQLTAWIGRLAAAVEAP